MSERRGYGGRAAIDRLHRRLEEPEPKPDPPGPPVRKVWMESVGPDRLMTHYVGDDCPGGHEGEGG